MEGGQDDKKKRACGGPEGEEEERKVSEHTTSLLVALRHKRQKKKFSLSKLLAAEVDFLSFFLSLPCLFLLILPTLRLPSSPVLPLLEMNTWPQDQRQTPTGRPARPLSASAVGRWTLAPGQVLHMAGGRDTQMGPPGGGPRALHPHASLVGGQWLMHPSEALPVTAMILSALLLIFCVFFFFILFLELMFLTAECFTYCLHAVTHCSSSSSSLYSSLSCSLLSQGADSSQ